MRRGRRGRRRRRGYGNGFESQENTLQMGEETPSPNWQSLAGNL